MNNNTPEAIEMSVPTDEPAPVLIATIELVPDAAPMTIKFSLQNMGDKPLTLNKTNTCWRGRLGSNVFVVFPERDSEILKERVKYIGAYVNHANDKGQNEFVLGPAESMTRELVLEPHYDFASWQKRGCSRFWVHYRAIHRLPGGQLVTVESAPLLCAL